MCTRNFKGFFKKTKTPTRERLLDAEKVKRPRKHNGWEDIYCISFARFWKGVDDSSCQFPYSNGGLKMTRDWLLRIGRGLQSVHVRPDVGRAAVFYGCQVIRGRPRRRRERRRHAREDREEKGKMKQTERGKWNSRRRGASSCTSSLRRIVYFLSRLRTPDQREIWKIGSKLRERWNN